MKLFFLTALCCLTTLWQSQFTQAQTDQTAPRAIAKSTRPNIVLIMADDLGFSDLGCYGSEIETPRLDALAQDGLRMTQFTNTAKCHSSRVSLLTGLYCDQAGAESLSRGTTIARELKAAGYSTLMTGKWHLDQQPTDQGFERYFGHLSGATNYFTGDDSFRLNGKPWNDFGDDFYTTVANTDYAIQFVDEALLTPKPFFLYVAYNAPHYPLQTLQSDYEKYRQRYRAGWDKIREQRLQKQKELKLFEGETISNLGRPSYIPAWKELSNEQQQWEADRMAAFAGMVDCLDREIGRLVDHLKSKQQFDNTLFVFVADNGACPFERTKGQEYPPYDSRSYWTYDTGWAHVGNTPFRYYKQNNHEGGIASPAIIHWPQGLKQPAGTIDNTPAHLVDIMATSLDIAGRDYPNAVEDRVIEPLVGRSLLPLIAGGQLQESRELYYHFGPNRALRSGDWKVVSLRSGPWELYNLAEDRNEAHDLSQQYPEKVGELSQVWHHIAEEQERLPAKDRRPVSDKPQHASFQKNGK